MAKEVPMQTLEVMVTSSGSLFGIISHLFTCFVGQGSRLVAEGTAAPNDEIRRLSEVVDLRWPTILLLMHPIKTTGETGGLGTSIASFGHDRKVLWQVEVSCLAMGVVVPYAGIRHLSGVVDSKRPVGVPERFTN